MLKEAFLEIYERDLSNLKKEINLYDDDEKLWIVRNEITNSAGNLCLHLLGNLNHFIGAELGNSGYIRDRDSEFSLKNASRDELTAKIEETRQAVKTALENLSEADFENPFPVEILEGQPPVNWTLIHLLTHFNYHLGQINYHRRLLS